MFIGKWAFLRSFEVMIYRLFSPFLRCLSETAKSESFDLNHLSSLLCQIFLGGGPCVSCDILNAAFDDHKPTYQNKQHCGEVSPKVGLGIHEPRGGTKPELHTVSVA